MPVQQKNIVDLTRFSDPRQQCFEECFLWPGDTEAEESKRAGHPLQDNEQCHDQRLQPVYGAHTNTGTARLG